MEKFISVEKMSKKRKKEYYSRKRKGWGGLSPVTRRAENPKAYSRAKEKGSSYGNRILSAIHKKVII